MNIIQERNHPNRAMLHRILGGAQVGSPKTDLFIIIIGAVTGIGLGAVDAIFRYDNPDRPGVYANIIYHLWQNKKTYFRIFQQLRITI